MDNIFYVNGSFVPANQAQLHITDLGLLRGYGIFDFFRAINGKTIFLEDHLDRFQASARDMGLEIPASRQMLRNIIAEIVRRNPTPMLGIKMILTGGYSPDGYSPTTPNFFVVAKPFQFMDAPDGLTLMTVEHQRELANIKTLNYLVPVYLLRQMNNCCADDVLYHWKGNVTESSRSNIFIVKNGTVITAQDGVLAGVTRKHVIGLAQKHFKFECRNISLEETLAADEVFTTGSTKRIIAITTIDKQVIGNGKQGAITAQLFDLFLAFEQEKN